MVYGDGSGGRFGREASGGGSFTAAEVEERLIEAMLTCWRGADRERGWQRLRSAWPEITREAWAGDYDGRGGDGTSADVAIRPASLTRREVAEMEEAFGWTAVLSGEDRKVVGLAIKQLARGVRQVSWERMLRQLGMVRGSDGLRKRYGRAIAALCAVADGGNPRADVSSR